MLHFINYITKYLILETDTENNTVKIDIPKKDSRPNWHTLKIDRKVPNPQK